MLRRTTYLLFLDECGTHDMLHIDEEFPVFVLLGLLVGETYYAKTLVPRVKALKLKHLGTTAAVLHSRDIRRCDGAFQFLRQGGERKTSFLAAIGNLFAASRLRLYAVVIDKRRLKQRFLATLNPYDVSLSQLLSVCCGPSRMFQPTIARIIAESRGRREDRELQREYQSLRGAGLWNYGSRDVQNRRVVTVTKFFPTQVHFVRKSDVVAGLELADLAAYPIARATISNDWGRADCQVVMGKIRSLVNFP